MATKTKQKNSAEEKVFLVNSSKTSPGKIITKNLSDMKHDWDQAMEQVSVMIDNTDSKMKGGGFKLEEITVGLGFNASGKLGFVEAGVEASVALTFRRPKQP